MTVVKQLIVIENNRLHRTQQNVEEVSFFNTDGSPFPSSQRGEYSGEIVTLSVDGDEGSSSYLPMENFDFGVELFDRTVPEHPQILVGGIYAVTASIEINDPPISDGLFFVLHLDHGNWDFVNEQDILQTDRSGRSVICSLSVTGYVPIGGIIDIQANNRDTDGTHDVSLRELGIQRVA